MQSTTPGHTAFHVSSGKDQLIGLGDTTNIPALFVRNPGWHGVCDQDAATPEATRRKLLDRVAADQVMVTGYHFPFPAIGIRDALGYGRNAIILQGGSSSYSLEREGHSSI